jgi:radical SAM superfamily enzyme YgiQ (UPF0313 family)
VKILICTSKVRPDGQQTFFPPYGAMAIVQTLIKAGFDQTFLYDIDGLRPSFSDIKKHFLKEKPDVVGISGVVSTAYNYIKDLIKLIREVLPETIIIVGGNVAANSEILHKICGVEYCVIGEGELSSVELLNYIQNIRPKRSTNDQEELLKKILGITFLDKKGVVHFTGYTKNIPAEELYDLDYDILERDTDVSKYILDPWSYTSFGYDPRSYEPKRKNKKLATLVSTKGCVAKCTFCHRWDHNIRFVPVDLIIERIKKLQTRYNVGFITFSDENWGSSKNWNDEFIEKIAPLDILWRVGGVRTKSVSLELLQKMRAAGCVNVQYGMETGSQTMLNIMEKKLKLEDNINAAKWTYEAKLHTVYAIVFAMPGETPQTIKETADFLKYCTEFLPDPPYGRLSINRLEALPGTPVYEYGKILGLIGRTPEEEEKYLLYISDTDGGDHWKQLNYTNYPDLIVQSWYRQIWFEVMHNWFIKNPQHIKPFWQGLKFNLSRLFKSKISNQEKIRKLREKQKQEDIDLFVDKDFNTQRDELQENYVLFAYHPIFYFFRHFALLEKILREFLNPQVPKKIWWNKMKELFIYYCAPKAWNKRRKIAPDQSLRKTVADQKAPPLTESEKNLIPLQLGR